MIHPILLNKLIHGPIGFHNGVRISTGLNTVLFIIANLVMRTRLPPTKKSNGSSVPLVAFARDTPYLFAVFGWALMYSTKLWILLTVVRGLLVLCGLFFPPFFLQLDAVKHGVDRDFAFYCVSFACARLYCCLVLKLRRSRSWTLLHSSDVSFQLYSHPDAACSTCWYSLLTPWPLCCSLWEDWQMRRVLRYLRFSLDSFLAEVSTQSIPRLTICA